MNKYLAFLLFLVFFPVNLLAFSIPEEKITLLRGDTFCIPEKDKVNYGGIVTEAGELTHQFRLYGIETPNIDQPYGDRALKTLDLILESKHPIDFTTVIKKGERNTFVRASIKNSDIATILVANGLAWVNDCGTQEYCIDLERLEQAAREKKVGLWADPHPVKPWVWSKRKHFTGTGYKAASTLGQDPRTSDDLLPSDTAHQGNSQPGKNKKAYTMEEDFFLEDEANFVYIIKLGTGGKVVCDAVKHHDGKINLYTTSFTMSLDRDEVAEIRRGRN